MMVKEGLAVWSVSVTKSPAETGPKADSPGRRGVRGLREPVEVAVEKARSQMEEDEERNSRPNLPVWRTTSASLPASFRRSREGAKLAAKFSRSTSEQKNSVPEFHGPEDKHNSKS